ncbi:carbon storage regulator [Blastopirellula marina]|uniref:Translational regulator CsrA n=1 Tax=Blastopirellula marina TaxID=124 RepID=A0A2S8GUP0_9BACT|nr:hypothetical protein C5Y93_00145 [Blastopirellula marina]
MLVLTRKQQQQIQIGEGVTITILKVKGNTVRIGIDAPSDVKVVRSELEPEEKPASPKKQDSPVSTPQIDKLQIDKLEAATSQPVVHGKEAAEYGKEDYQVLSFRVKTQKNAEKSNQSPRAVSMREFIASRAANAVG